MELAWLGLKGVYRGGKGAVPHTVCICKGGALNSEVSDFSNLKLKSEKDKKN